MDNLTLSDMLAMKAEALSEINRTIEGLSPAQTKFCASPESWTIANTIEHLALVEVPMVRLIGSLLARIEKAGTSSDPGPTAPTSVQPLYQESLQNRYITRDRYAPTGTASIESSLGALESAQAQLFALDPRLRSVDLNSASFPHWIFGPLTLGQWIAFLGLHEERHLEQMKMIMALPAYPEGT